MPRKDAVIELKATYKILSEDLDEIVAYGKRNPSGFTHRALVRTHFSLIEGLAYQLRQVALSSSETHEGVFSADEISLLREEKYVVNKKGEPEARDNFQPTLENLLFSIRCYLKIHGAQYKPDTGKHGWEAMKKLVKIRNQLIHPKSSSDLIISDQQLTHVAEAATWWKQTMLEMFKACKEADQYWSKNQN